MKERPKIAPYLVAPPHRYFPPWPTPPPSKDGVFGVSAGGFTFRFTVGQLARQIFEDGHSYPCRKITIVAPGLDYSFSNTQSVFYAVGPSPNVLDGASELPPNTSETIPIDDVNKLWFVAQNATDIIFGRVEA